MHHAKVVRGWLTTHAETIAVFRLPSYAPELNLDEYLNGDLKTDVHSGIPARAPIALVQTVLGNMRMLQSLPKRIRKYFDHPCNQYAA